MTKEEIIRHLKERAKRDQEVLKQMEARQEDIIMKDIDRKEAYYELQSKLVY